MIRHVLFFLAVGAFALLLSGTPAAAQNQGDGNGQGPFGVTFCKAFIDMCPEEIPPFGACVSVLNVCINPGGGNLDECCEKCNATAVLCGINPSICAVFGCS
jgi:hypothetical protein